MGPISADFNPLDTSQRGKVLAIIQQLADAGLSDTDIMKYFGQSQALGRQSLSDYLTTAGTAISRQFQPQIDQTRDFLGANPLLADSGYSNRLGRQILTDLAERTSQDYNREAANLSGQNMDFYRNLVGQRAGLRSGLASNAYQTFTGLPRKKKFGEQALSFLGQVGGSLLGGAVGGPPNSTPSASDLQDYRNYITSPQNVDFERRLMPRPAYRPYGNQ